MKFKPLRRDLSEYLKKHNITTKFNKAKKLFEQNPRHPSLNTEILEPHHHGIYSFGIDKKYRALFFFDGE